MANIDQLLSAANETRKVIAEGDQRIAGLRSRLTADSQAVIDHAAIDINDREALLTLTARKQAIELVPVQIQQIDERKGDAVRELLDIADQLKRGIINAAGVEQQALIKEIAGLLAPYSTEMRAPTGGTFDPALNAAAQMPAVTAIGAMVSFAESRPNEENGKRGTVALSADRFDSEALTYADEIENRARLFLNNGKSFVVDPFKSWLSKTRK